LGRTLLPVLLVLNNFLEESLHVDTALGRSGLGTLNAEHLLAILGSALVLLSLAIRTSPLFALLVLLGQHRELPRVPQIVGTNTVKVNTPNA